MCAEIADMIAKGIEEVRQESKMTTIFEGSIFISNVSKAGTISVLKSFLSNFKSDMYLEKGDSLGSFKVHFYSWQRAKEAHSFILNTPNEFSNAQLVHHRKEIGTNSTSIVATDAGPAAASAATIKAAFKRKQKRDMVADNDGFLDVV